MSDILKKHLNYRDKKAKWINDRIIQNKKTIIAFRCNIPGPEKCTWWSRKLFEEGSNSIKRVLSKNAISYKDISQELKNEVELMEYNLILETLESGDIVKKICMVVENENQVGRIFDIDVYSGNGLSLKREDFGYEIRKCYICENFAFECVRNRSHSLVELTNYLILKAEAL